jgi:hypothetical protein
MHQGIADAFSCPTTGLMLLVTTTGLLRVLRLTAVLVTSEHGLPAFGPHTHCSGRHCLHLVPLGAAGQGAHVPSLAMHHHLQLLAVAPAAAWYQGSPEWLRKADVAGLLMLLLLASRIGLAVPAG